MFKNYLSVLLILVTLSSNAALRRIAAEVDRMHKLNVAFYQHDLFTNVNNDGENLKADLTKGTQANIIPGKLASLVSQAASTITLTVPFEGSVITVELVRTNIFTDDFTVLAGENKIQHYTPGVYYRGTIKGNPNSLSAFSFFNSELYGIISDESHGNIVVAKMLTPGNKFGYVIYSDRNLKHQFPDFCHSVGQEPAFVTAARNARVLSQFSTAKCARIYYEIDNTLFGDNGNDVVTTSNWITAVHNNIQTLYANDNIDVALSQVYIWTSPDPYTGANSTDQLNTFRQTRLSFNGDVAQLVARDNGYGGLGYLDAVCTNTNYSYADVDFGFNTVPSYSWTVEAMTHEIGHNLGSMHTHNCGWPIGALDDCYATEGGCPPGPTPVNGGTIMSYCHLSATGINFVNGFSQYPRDTIIYTVNHATCLGASCAICPTPAHDACSSPATLGITSNCVTVAGNLCGATESIPPISCNGFTATHGYDVWYRVVPSQATMNIICNSGTSTDVVLGLYTGTCGSLSLVNCADSSGTNGTEIISTTVTIGTPYYIRVYDHNSNTAGTDFSICVSENCLGGANNTCASATPLTIGNTCSYTDGDLCSATQSMNPTLCSSYTSAVAYDQWYSITPTQSTVQITGQAGVNTDLVLGIYSGTCGALNLDRCIDTTGSGGTEQFTITLTPGNTYYIRLYDWNGNMYGTDYKICARYICTTPTAPTSATATAPSICAGSSTTLNLTGTLSANATWHWYSGSCGGTAIGTGTSVSVSPASTTNYYVRAENGTCYSACRNVTVNVIPIPNTAVSATATPPTICQGGSSALTVTGTLSAGAGWYWYQDSCGGTVVGTGITFSVSPAGTETFYVRAQNGICYSSCRSTVVTLITSPTAPASISATNDSICAGDSVTLTINGTLSSGATWHWYSASCGTTSAGTGVSITKAPSANTTWYVRAENGSCNSTCVNKTIRIYSTPGSTSSAGPSSSVCAGSPATITVNGTLGSGSNWNWYLDSCGGPLLAQGASLPLTPTATHTYFVRAENTKCKSACSSATISVNALPASPTINVSGNILSVPASSDYQWYFSANGITFNTTATTQQITALNDGYYFVTIFDANGCTANSDTVFYLANGIAESISDGVVTVYPNPAHNTLNVVIHDKSISVFDIKLYDATGKLVFSEQRNSGEQATISLQTFAKGVYEIVVVEGNETFRRKIVKE